MNILFLGLGAAGQRHLRNVIECLNGNYNLFSVTNKSNKAEIKNDLTINQKTNIYKKYDLKLYKSKKEVFKNKIDLTIISSPTKMHFQDCKDALLSDSHVYIEKPVTLDSESCLELINLSKRKKRKVSVSFQLRFTPWIKKLKEIIEDNRYGTPIYVSAIVSEYMPNWHPYEDYRNSYAAKKSLGGGVVFTQIHEIDFLYYLFGELQYISSLCGKYSNLEIDVEDTAITIMKGEMKGKEFPINLTQTYLGEPRQREMIIQYSNAKIICNFIKGKLEIFEKGVKNTIDFPDFQRNDAFLYQLDLFIKNINNEKYNTPVSLQEAMKSVEIAENILKNANR